MKLRFKNLNINDFQKFCTEDMNNREFLELYNVCNGSPGMLKIVNSEEGKIINQQTLKMLNHKSFNFDDFNLLYELVSKNYDEYLLIVINCFFKSLKEIFIQSSDDIKKKRNILIFFSNIEIITKKNINLDKKKELHYLFSEYFLLGLANE